MSIYNIFCNIRSSLLALLTVLAFCALPVSANAQTLAEAVGDHDAAMVELQTTLDDLESAKANLSKAKMEHAELKPRVEAAQMLSGDVTLGEKLAADLERYEALEIEIAGLSGEIERLNGVKMAAEAETASLRETISTVAAADPAVIALKNAIIAKATAEAETASLREQLAATRENIAVLTTERNAAYTEMVDNCDRNRGLIVCSKPAHMAAIASTAAEGDEVAQNDN